MTNITILGGGGMIGQKLAQEIVGSLPFPDVNLTLIDQAFPASSPPVQQTVADISDPATARAIARARPDVIFHLAAIVSGQAETDFDLGWQINMRATWQLLEALKDEHLASGGTYLPRLVFSSSIAVFGGPFPEKIDDTFLSAPQTSYGAQKAACELMVTDYSRKGFVDGISIRLPTICVRPGKANAAASSFFSGIIREPLNGVEAILPVPDTVRHTHASPRAAISFLLHAAKLETALLEGRRALNMPGVGCSVAEQIEALRKAAGQKAVDRIKPAHDPAIATIVAGWPRDFAPERATALGFKAEDTFDEIVQIYIQDELSA